MNLNLYTEVVINTEDNESVKENGNRNGKVCCYSINK